MIIENIFYFEGEYVFLWKIKIKKIKNSLGTAKNLK